MPESVQAQMKQAVDELMNLSESDLEKELGRRLAATEDELRTSPTLTAALPSGPTVDLAVLQGVPAFVRATGKRFLEKFNRQMYSLVCDKDDKDSEVIRRAFTQGWQAVAYALTGVFVASFAWLPATATVVAVIVVKRAGGAGYDAFCETWKENL